MFFSSSDLLYRVLQRVATDVSDHHNYNYFNTILLTLPNFLYLPCMVSEAPPSLKTVHAAFKRPKLTFSRHATSFFLRGSYSKQYIRVVIEVLHMRPGRERAAS